MSRIRRRITTLFKSSRKADVILETRVGLLATSEDYFRLADHPPRTRSDQKSVMPLPIPIIVVSALGGYRESRPVAAPFFYLGVGAADFSEFLH
jgi:hypothetical protein